MPNHMPAYGESGTVETETVGGRIVDYVATGSEGVDFFVPIGATLGSDVYKVGFFAAHGAAVIPAVWDFPELLDTDRTSTQFRVLIPAPLNAGDKFQFQISKVTSTTTTTYTPDDDCGCSGGGSTPWKYTAAGDELATFTVTIPDALQVDGEYAVTVAAGVLAFQMGFNTINHTETTFDLVCGAPLTAGDVLYFTIGAL